MQTILIVDMNFKKNSLGFHEFVMPIISILRDKRTEVIHYTEITRSKANDSDRVILSGNALKDQRYLKDFRKFDWIKRCNRPVLGICAGMHSIGLMFGSRLIKCEEIGLLRIRTVLENPLLQSTFDAYALHSYALEPSQDFDVLAESIHCVQAIKHKTLNVFGVLFHPEVRNKDIIERFGSLHG
jgi:GMP synthase-like glutamine amidotransferase